jgi:hypothetical protein
MERDARVRREAIRLEEDGARAARFDRAGDEVDGRVTRAMLGRGEDEDLVQAFRFSSLRVAALLLAS